MHYLIYYSSTQSKLDDTWIYYQVLTYFEFACICLSYPMVIFLGYQLFQHRVFHNNLQNLVKAAVVEYLVQLTARSIQIFLIFNSAEDGLVFYYASLARCTCYFFVSFSLPCFVFERCCASYFLSDYEKRSRYYIGIFLLSASAGSGFILSYLYHKSESTLIYHTIALVFNMTFSIILVIVEKYNYKRLRESSNLRKSKREYSLAERFQISENIRVCELMKTIINVVSIFNLLSTVSASLDNFNFSQTFLNVAATLFNFCVLIYGTLVFSLFYYLIPQFRSALKDVFMKMKILNAVASFPDLRKEKPMKVAVEETNTYFTQLQQQWT
ncbi:Serpentine Receptor, class E (Epsilon) [Caenorhabditis elegans]|uniref:Serpentine Receptor, class E (Epsilon) n=1 Tax=Caenorhabditis elegans TaxID=6239 RepID=Q17781_CAEEL|nr:Serpentine Receptor, class E (Epsilon) [Caenorhabditis elegans]CCD63531.1 Serpentine Receptor, class E (Epsilon) [Caenorhabditis elegans]|eukprot:NP_495548.3 Serpentine Receptor, class E (epsilon) [Caenorhabditis elegans]